ncbi:putative HTH-type transcriptional regulator YxaF [Ensifer psoraleae]|uniref:TetR/AcrR family transcriptional regulator n=1 Tax=Sinorhizobium psoraleae TaxID=520838 RepID=UPI00156966D7|nr:TetR/AcrR family transcriptional regulator [Sinorhizobium psoraleae]NRP70740.1 putative HTH-type transcriptional regulator YxaF [Sinorhizobium psoraleae]
MAKIVAERSDVIPVLAEIFREHGFEGASLSVISAKTGLGKGSLYHFFPGGKEEMATTVLREIDQWFDDHVYAPLRQAEDPREAIGAMCRSVADYFRSGRRVCLVGAFALDNIRDRFADQVRDYFAGWRAALATALEKTGNDPASARELAEEAVIAIQGALVLGRALDDPAVFERALARVEARLLAGKD